MTKGASFAGKPAFLLICCVVVGILWAQPAANQDRRVDGGSPSQSQAARLPALSPLLAGTLRRLDDAGVTGGTVGASAVAHFSTPLVHLNQGGNSGRDRRGTAR
jgi:hypothetical protein